MRNSAQVDPSGRVWLATSSGIIYVDPKRVDRRSDPPILSARAVHVDGKLLNPSRTVNPGALALTIDYFGLNLSNPTGVNYRYRLTGFESQWEDVGSRTEAIYTHLKPGTYVFEVSARNAAETWSLPLRFTPFTVLPAFYQTWWFQIICFTAALLLLWFGFKLRVRYITATIRVRAEERADERIRIARELHDTLLQGVVGLQLSVHTAAQKVPPEHDSRFAIEKALITADHLIVEGRDRVSQLRLEYLTSEELESGILALGAAWEGRDNARFGFERIGSQRDLRPQVAGEVFFIAREAITNAFRHSRASRILVTIEYGKSKFTLSCHDDGIGIRPLEIERSQERNHWGLRGMSERSQGLGGDFRYEAEPLKGTDVVLSVPAANIYADNFSIRRLFRSRL
jgi:anti-sigma regulatory factor (Ser/Thr protein kinase)